MVVLVVVGAAEYNAVEDEEAYGATGLAKDVPVLLLP